MRPIAFARRDPTEARAPSRLGLDALPTPPDLALYESERAAIQRRLSEAWGHHRSLPWDTFVVIVDLRGGFGRLLGLHMCDRITVDRRIRRARGDGALPSLSVPLTVPDGLALVEALAPELLPVVYERPAHSVPMLMVDAYDVPRVGFGIVSRERVTIH